MREKISGVGVLPFASAMLLLIATAGIVGASAFSPDSWAYLELAKTIWSERFYEFNTYRSYFSEVHSASFPLGYPVLISLLQLVAGADPRVAVVLNVLAAAASWWLIAQAGRWLGVSRLGVTAVASALFLYPGYLDEVLAGRSIPAAILAFLVGICCLIRARPFVAGLFLGASALVRFDFLVYGFLAIFVCFLIRKASNFFRALALLGFLAGLLPWIVYSYVYFGKMWISDNSWVAASVAKAFVLDFPAKAELAAANAPVLWVLRWLGNIFPLLASFLGGLLKFPLVIISLGFFLASLSRIEKRQRWTALVVILVGAASLAPYLLTGYFDQRYFALIFLCFSAVFIFSSDQLQAGSRGHASAYRYAMLGSIIASFAIGGFSLFEMAKASIQGEKQQADVELAISALSKCHRNTPDITYIFKDEVMSLAPRYGARTGFRAAFIPSNFGRMTDTEKAAYLKHMEPYRIFSNLEEAKECGA
ncbi:hypothetical protein [Variovorax gossypii]